MVDVCRPYSTSSRTRGADGEFIEEPIRKTLEIVEHLVGNSNRDNDMLTSLEETKDGGEARGAFTFEPDVVTSFRRSKIWT